MLQLGINIITSACLCMLVASGCCLAWKVSKFFNMSHGASYIVGAYLTYTLFQQVSCPLWLAVVTGTVAAVITGCCIDILVFTVFTRRKSGPLVLFLISVSLLSLAQNVVSLIYEDSPKALWTVWSARPVTWSGIHFTNLHMALWGATIVIATSLAALLKIGHYGLSLNAISSNPVLAGLVGLNVSRFRLLTVAIASALVGVAGIFGGMDGDLTPAMGANAILLGITAMIIGGMGSIRGAALGALAIAALQNVSNRYMTSGWQDLFVYAAMIICLIKWPNGIFGWGETWNI